MTQFKVGDWAYVIKPILTRSQYIEQGTIIKYHKRIQADGSVSTNDDSLKPWKPKAGEWCWFRSVSGNYELGKFVEEYHPDKYRYELNGTNCFFNCSKKRCEPFIGELPSFIKDGR